jgi:hypothetical protein
LGVISSARATSPIVRPFASSVSTSCSRWVNEVVAGTSGSWK